MTIKFKEVNKYSRGCWCTIKDAVVYKALLDARMPADKTKTHGETLHTPGARTSIFVAVSKTPEPDGTYIAELTIAPMTEVFNKQHYSCIKINAFCLQKAVDMAKKQALQYAMKVLEQESNRLLRIKACIEEYLNKK